MKLLIGVPCFDQMPVDFVRCLIKLMDRLKKDGIEYEPFFASGSLVYIAREKIVEKAVKDNFTHVLWIDSDEVFDDDIVEKLTRVSAPIVCALMRGRHPPYNYNICDTIHHIVDIVPKFVFEIFMCGFGCVLTEVEALKAVAKANGGRCFTPSNRLGEDFQFCERAQNLGIKIYCQPAAKVGHIGKVVVWPDKVPT